MLGTLLTEERHIGASRHLHAAVFDNLPMRTKVNSHGVGSKIDLGTNSIGSPLVNLPHVGLDLLLLAGELGQLDFVGIGGCGGEVDEAGSLGSGTTVNGQTIIEAIIIADFSEVGLRDIVVPRARLDVVLREDLMLGIEREEKVDHVVLVGRRLAHLPGRILQGGRELRALLVGVVLHLSGQLLGDDLLARLAGDDTMLDLVGHGKPVMLLAQEDEELGRD